MPKAQRERMSLEEMLKISKGGERPKKKKKKAKKKPPAPGVSAFKAARDLRISARKAKDAADQ